MDSLRAVRGNRPFEKLCSSLDSFDEDDQDRLALQAMLEREI